MIIQLFKESYINPLSLQGIIYVVVKDVQPNMRGFYCDDETIKHPITLDEDEHLDMETVNKASFLAVFRKFNVAWQNYEFFLDFLECVKILEFFLLFLTFFIKECSIWKLKAIFSLRKIRRQLLKT